ncbi:hypothetical protein CMEL01_12955 [Colletotrichum melonis]|uniref:Uncharacterized protein n=1 Tax=Colletotrichum melonis TaxID=1209925 RepID=A0AAI9UWF1_9PEZI|nr:hypothetical protein CMEL01_12955 [Colletotrichum melonis]
MEFCGWRFWHSAQPPLRLARLFLPWLSQILLLFSIGIPDGLGWHNWLDLAGVLRLWTSWTWQTCKAGPIPFSMKWMMEQNRSCPCLGLHAAACNKRPVGGWDVHANGQPYQAKPTVSRRNGRENFQQSYTRQNRESKKVKCLERCVVESTKTEFPSIGPLRSKSNASWRNRTADLLMSLGTSETLYHLANKAMSGRSKLLFV